MWSDFEVPKSQEKCTNMLPDDSQQSPTLLTINSREGNYPNASKMPRSRLRGAQSGSRKPDLNSQARAKRLHLARRRTPKCRVCVWIGPKCGCKALEKLRILARDALNCSHLSRTCFVGKGRKTMEGRLREPTPRQAPTRFAHEQFSWHYY